MNHTTRLYISIACLLVIVGCGSGTKATKSKTNQSAQQIAPRTPVVTTDDDTDDVASDLTVPITVATGTPVSGAPQQIPAFKALVGLYWAAAEGAHRAGYPASPCPSAFTYAGSFADCGGGKCLGNQILCRSQLTSIATQTNGSVLTDVYISNINTRTPGACPSGFSPLPLQYGQGSTVANCMNGQCSGSQAVCQKLIPANQLTLNSEVILDLIVSPEGSHTLPSCPADYSPVGIVADMGLGQFKGGYQIVCGKFAKISSLFK